MHMGGDYFWTEYLCKDKKAETSFCAIYMH